MRAISTTTYAQRGAQLSGAADSGTELLDRRPPRAALVTMLSLASGVTGAISFSYLGGVFTSVITGTLVVFGLSVANASGSTVVRALVAFAAYAPRRVRRAVGGGDAAVPPAGESRPQRSAIACLTGETGLLAAMWGTWLDRTPVSPCASPRPVSLSP
jgi:hypothetical protein